MKRRSGFFLLLFISFVSIIIVIVSINRINRARIKSGFKDLSIAGGETIKDLIEVSGYHLIEQGEEALKNFLDGLYDNRSILYTGLKKGDELIYLLSRYEGYFPVMSSDKDIRFISSPVGMIFEVKGKFSTRGSSAYTIFLGFDYHFLISFEKSAGKYFLLVIGIILGVLLIMVILVLRYDKILYKKDLEFITEKEEKERLLELSLLTSEIAHEIKNPLNSIYLSFNSLDQFMTGSDDAVFYKNAIKSEIDRVSEIINSYSELSLSIEVNYSVIDIKKLIDEFRILKKPEMEQKGIRFEIISNVEEFITDRDLFIQILLNLVNNAMEADAGNVQIKLTKEKSFLRIIVKDDGKGIDPEKREKIFKPYVSSKTKGMGLGLHITLKNIRALKGRIELVSGEDGNKVFIVTLNEGKL